MATQLWFVSVGDYSTGNNEAKLNGSTTTGWTSYAMQAARGSLLQNLTTTCVVGPTKQEVLVAAAGNPPIVWYSPPIAADAVISGSITWNLWASESAMTANVAINGQIEVIDPVTGVITLIDQTARTTEVGTASAVNNFAETPAAGVAVKRGDRLRVRIFAANSIDGNIAAGTTFTFNCGVATAGVSGDSYITLTENLTFEPEPEGTIVYLTDSASPVATASVDRIASTSRGAGVQTDVRNTVAGPTAPLQMTDTAGGTVVDWFTDTLPAMTIGGAVRCNIRAVESSANANTCIGVEIARVAGDGTGAVVWAKGISPPEVNISETANSFLVSGDDLAITSGQRLRIRVYIDDQTLLMAAGFTTTLYYGGTTAGASGDTWLQFNFNFDGSPIPPKLYFRGALTDYGTGNRDTNLAGAATTWVGYLLSPVRGATNTGGQTTAFPTGPTNGVEIGGKGVSNVWYSPPLAGDLTIAGSITWNLWGWEGAATSDSAINGILEVIDGATGAITQILKTTRTVEVAPTTSALNNFAETPPAGVTCKKGDRLRVRVFADDAPVVVSGGSMSFRYDGATPGVDYDSWMRLTEIPAFVTEPAGTRLYLTNEASDVTGSLVEREAWRGRGQAVQTDVTNTVAGPTAPIQMTDTAGGTAVEWYTRPLGAMTLGGAVRCNIRALNAAGSNSTVRVEVARVEADGTSPTVWATGMLPQALTTSDAAQSFLISGDDIAISDGQRLRIRVYIDEAMSNMVTGTTITMSYGGTTAAAAGDTYLTFPTVIRPPGQTWEPTDVPDVLVALDADGMDVTNNAPIAVWTDVSLGAPHDYRQATGANQPLYQTNIAPNGAGGLLFANDKSLQNLEAVTLAPQTTGYSLFTVIRPTGDGSGSSTGSYMIVGKDNNNGFFYYPSSDRLELWAEPGSSVNRATASTTVPDATVGIAELIWPTTGAAQVWHNGVAKGSPAGAFTPSSGQWPRYIGEDNFDEPFIGHIFAVVVVGRVVTQAEREKIEGFLAWRYGIETLLPVGHPYKITGPNGEGGPGGTVYTITLTGDLTPITGALVTQGAKRVAGAVTSGGFVRKGASRALTGGLASAGLARKGVARTLTGSLGIPSGTVSLVEPAAVVPITFTGDMAPAGLVVKRDAKTLTAATTPAGAIAKRDVKTLAGSTASSGLLVKRDAKTLAGSATSAGTIARHGTKALTGVSASSGALVKQDAKAFTGSATSAGALAKRDIKTLTGATTPAGALVNRSSVSRTMTGAVAAGGVLATRVSLLRTYTASLASSGSLTDRANRLLTGSMSSAGLVREGVRRTFAGATAPSGTVGKVRPLPTLTGSITGAGSLTTSTGVLSRIFTGALASTGSVRSAASKTLAGSVAPSGSIAKRANRLFTASATPTGAVSKRIARSLTGFVTPAGSLSTFVGGTITPRTFTGTLGSAGALGRRPAKVASGTLATSGNLGRRSAIARGGTLGSSGALRWTVATRLAGSVTPTGSLSTFVGGTVIPRTFTASLGSAGALGRRVGSVTAGSLGSTGTLGRRAAINRTFTGTLAATGSVRWVVAKASAGSLTPAATLTNFATGTTIVRTFTGSLGSSGAMGRRVAVAKGGTIAPTGTLGRRVASLLAGTLSPAGSVRWNIRRTLAGSMASSGVLTPQKTAATFSVTTSGGLGPTGALRRSASRSFAGALVPSGVVGRRSRTLLAGSIATVGDLRRQPRFTYTGTIAPTGVRGTTRGTLFAGTLGSSATWSGAFIEGSRGGSMDVISGGPGVSVGIGAGGGVSVEASGGATVGGSRSRAGITVTMGRPTVEVE